MYGQGKEVTTGIGFLGAYNGTQNGNSIVDADQYGTRSLAGNAARFQGDGVIA
jgi:hypothetical protein